MVHLGVRNLYLLMGVYILNITLAYQVIYILGILFNRISSDEKERLRRLKEMKTKQVEMEAIREAELKHKRKVCCDFF